MKKILLLMLLLGLSAACQKPRERGPKPQPPVVAQAPDTVRFAAYNASLSRPESGQLITDLSTPNDPQARKIAEVLQRTRPQVVLINEFDFDPDGRAAELFKRNYLEVPQAPPPKDKEETPVPPIVYPYVYQPRVNAGEPTGLDLNRDGRAAGAADAHGWGEYPGHYGMLVLSQFPIDTLNTRAFRTLRWADMPGNLMPRDHYSEQAAATLRLSSKTHADVPILINGAAVHALISHPTPPVFDGPEDRNGKRNHDEIRLWADYISDDPARQTYLVDDAGEAGGLAPGAWFVILGDMNADPHDGDSVPGAIQQLLDHPRVVAVPTPAGRGGIADAQRDGAKSWGHRGRHMHDTADFPDTDGGPGNLRVDYALPGKPLRIQRGGVYWTTPREPWHDIIDASDHRLVFVDLLLPGVTPPAPPPPPGAKP